MVLGRIIIYALRYMRGPKEVRFAGSVANWIAENLESALAENLKRNDVKANLEQFDVAGHSIPVAVIGTGLGPKPASIFPPIPCAPDGFNHKEFFSKCKPPCAHFVAKDYGHIDMLDDDKSGCKCKNGTGPRDLTRRTVGG
ncbi:hypothetical protein L6164_034518 [Bauhinia variegata]|uniref:Uncharacterized protein n=1 Tax=Bauhinia variegata TaxID=167791 RepID=A0ACB9KVF6_BAUVA|nr:hypothetical protein L6164_034518 [Bauhinia variegata]